MGKVNVYLPDDLEREVRDAGVPISSVCQAALRACVDAVTAVRGSGAAPATTPTFTPRLLEILDSPVARKEDATAIDLLGAIILHGENLGARVLLDLGVELPVPKERKARGRRVTSATDVTPLSPDVREVLAAALLAALDLRHNYVGAEHVVIALAGASSPVAGLFAALSLDERSVRNRVERLITNPWRTDAAPDTVSAPTADARLARFESDLQRLSEELHMLRGMFVPGGGREAGR